MSGTVTLAMATGAVTLAPQGTKNIRLPSTPVTLDLSPVTGRLSFAAGSLGDVGLPLPSVVPLSLSLTPTNLAQVEVSLQLASSPIDQASAFGLQIVLGPPTIVPTIPFFASDIRTAIEDGLRRLLSQLGVKVPQPTFTLLPDRESVPGIRPPRTTVHGVVPSDIWEPFPGVGPTLAEINTIASRIATAAQDAIKDVLGGVGGALKELTARTGRLIFPRPGVGATCDTALLPTAATAQVVLTSETSGPILQVGFFRTGVSVAPFDFPPFTPSAAAEVEVRIGNDFLLGLLSCLVEKLPNFTFLSPAASTGVPARNCRMWPIVTLELWPLALNGTVELCIMGGVGSAKSIALQGNFRQDIPNTVRFAVEFVLTLNLQLNDVAAVTGLRLASVSVTPYVRFDPRMYLLLLFVGPTILTALIESVLGGLVNTLLNRAHFLTSPVAVPPGIFEAFGPFVPASLTIDDLKVTGTFATPTEPWALLPTTPPKLPALPFTPRG